MNGLNKSAYSAGQNCPLALWRDIHAPAENGGEVDVAAEMRKQEGEEIGELARKLHPAGILAEGKFTAALEQTEKLRQTKPPAIFEAAAKHLQTGAIARADILKRARGGGWHLIEVKAAKNNGAKYVADIAFQLYVFRGAGWDIRRCFLQLLNGDYVRRGDVEVKKLFAAPLDKTKEAEAEAKEIAKRAPPLIKMMQDKCAPKVEIGRRCGGCAYRPECWGKFADFSIYNIFQVGRAEKIHREIKSVDPKKLPKDCKLTRLQKIALDVHSNGQPEVNPLALFFFLRTIEYPASFLDYEAVSYSVPLYDNTAPMQEVPFQFSLHTQEKQGGALRHYEFLHTKRTDPRPFLLDALLKNLPQSGTIFVYSESYEKRVHRQLGEDFPQHKDALEKINARIVDIGLPFQKRALYDPSQNFGWSLKSVFPAFCRAKGYENLAIKDGENAAAAYLDFLKKKRLKKDEEKKLWQDLRQYCAQDTKATADLLAQLYKFAK